MFIDIVRVLILIAAISLFAWLTGRAWRSKRAILKWVGAMFAGLLTLILTLFTLIALVGFYKLNASLGNPISSLKAGGTPEQVASAGRYAHICAGCHSTTHDLPLDGGQGNMVTSGRPPVGALYAPNLTPAGPLKDWSDGRIIRAIREGVDESGRPLLVMPSEIFHNLSDADVQALVAYLRAQPAVQHETGETELNVLGAFVVGAGLVQPMAQPPITQPVVSPPRGVTTEYGKYLVSISACELCHGADLAGGASSGLGPPGGPNLTALGPQWTDVGFIKAIRTGVDPEGDTLNTDQMPCKEISAMYDDDQLEAIYAYLHGLTPITKPAK